MKLCECGCTELIPEINTHGKPARFKTHHNIKFIRKAEIGHKVKQSRNYILIKKPDHLRASSNGYVLEHIIVWEENNKACLLKWSSVHHINGIKDDNNISNLMAMMSRDHSKLEAKLVNGHIGVNYKKKKEALRNTS